LALTEFDKRVQEHKDKALEAMKRVPEITELLDRADNETYRANEAVDGARQAAEDAQQIAMEAQEMAGVASQVTPVFLLRMIGVASQR